MTTKRKTYQQRAEQLAKAVDIADNIVQESKVIPEESKAYFLNYGKQVKSMALNPEPQFKKVASIQYLENDFLTYWNEADGSDIEKFWLELHQNEIDYERKDTIQVVLKRKKIKDIHEYNAITDNIVVAEQLGRITKGQAIELSQLIGGY